MNIIVQTTGGDASSLNSKIKIPDNTLADIKRAIIMNSSHNKELWCFSYQCAICLSCRIENRFCCGVPYFLWHGTITSYKHVKIWGVRVYIANGRATKKKLDDRSHRGYFMEYSATTWFILYWKPYQPFVIHIYHHVQFDGCNSWLSIEDNHTPGSLFLRKDPENHIHDSDLLNPIPCKLDLTSTPFRYTTIFTYELPPPG